MSLPNSSEHLLNATSTISHQNRRVALEEDFVPLCDDEDFSSMNSIRTAVINRPSEEDEELMADPLSVQVVTAEGETSPRIIERLLNWQYKEGNIIFHLASSNKLDEVVEPLRPGNSCIPLEERPVTVVELLRPGNSYMPVGVYSQNNQRARDPLHREGRAGTPLEEGAVTVVEPLRPGNSYMPVGVYSLNNQRLTARDPLHREGRAGTPLEEGAVTLRELLRAGNSYMPVGVYSLNNQGFTARDPPHREGIALTPLEERDVTVVLLPENSTREMLEKRAVTVTPLPPPPGGVHWDEKQAQVAVMVVFAATSFGIVCNIPTSVSTGDAGGIVFEAADVLTGHSPHLLYLVVFNTVVLGFSLGATVKEMWKFPFKPVLLFVSITLCFVYALLVDRVIPKFWVRIGSLNVVSSAMVWLLSGAYVASAAIAYYAVRYGFPYLNSKTTRGPRFRGNNILPVTA